MLQKNCSVGLNVPLRGSKLCVASRREVKPNPNIHVEFRVAQPNLHLEKFRIFSSIGAIAFGLIRE
ncbi:hypothetical protein [Nostoc sp. MG11]|uniref:hypothetical protein n=1 Tax=Nostoc sp. MG11 TaxID=2721166 RepID=UPI001868575C|nr:hypothetical protein [Nostoc sp. MG11]